MKKNTIAVLFGGCSNEYEVSLKSAYAVITHMNRDKYDIVTVGITRSGEWFRFVGEPERILTDTWNNSADCVSAIISPCRKARGLTQFIDGGAQIIKLDACFPVLHGKNGEDGTVQGLLELSGIPVIGCGALSSALCMNKDLAHRVAGLSGIAVPRSFVLRQMDAASALTQADEIGYPLFVKPLNGGSSIGMTKVEQWKNLIQAVKHAFEHDCAVIVEEAIDGVEVGCAVLGSGDNLIIGEVDEIELQGVVFDFHEKYTLSNAAIHVPARITPEKALEIKCAAKTIYNALVCSGFARVDMFLTHAGGIIFNEVNTIPGLTSHSRFPNMLAHAGISFEQMLDIVVGQAVSG